MSPGSENNALVEISLALSMAFFSLMVLTMVSMGATQVQKKTIVTFSTKGLSIKNADPTLAENSSVSNAQAVKPGKLAIYFRNQLYDAGLNPLAEHQLQSQKFKFLAVAPDLSMRQAISVRDRFGGDGLIVTTLDNAWLKSLKEKLK